MMTIRISFYKDKLRVEIFGKKENMGRDSASFVAGKLNQAIKDRGYANLILGTGASQYPVVIRYEGTEGWITAGPGTYRATSSDPVPIEKNARLLDASDPKILTSEINENEIHLYKADNQHGNWLDCIKSRKLPISTAEIGHRSGTVCLLSDIAMKLSRKLYWDPEKERFKNDEEANSMISRPQRSPYGTNYLKL